MRRTSRAPGRGRARRLGAALAAAALVLAAAACGTAGGDPRSVADVDTPLVIAIPSGHGDAGEAELGSFDEYFAKELSVKLGYGENEAVLKPTAPKDQLTALREGRVDMVVAGNVITPERERGVLFAGPYYVAHQDILVRSGDMSIGEVRDLAGKRVCRVRGDTAWQRISKLGGVAAEPVDAPSYPACVKMLRDHRVDAVSEDDLVLAGYVKESRGALRVVGAPFSDDRYGIALRKDDVTGCEAVNRAITSMYEDAGAQILLADTFGDSGVETATEVPQFEGCS